VRACACTRKRAVRGAGPGGGKSVHYLAVRVFLFVAGHGFSVPTRTRDRVFFLALGVDPESARGEGEGTTLCDFGDAAGRGRHDRAELGGSWPDGEVHQFSLGGHSPTRQMDISSRAKTWLPHQNSPILNDVRGCRRRQILQYRLRGYTLSIASQSTLRGAETGLKKTTDRAGLCPAPHPP